MQTEQEKTQTNKEGRITKCVGGLYSVRFPDGSEIACKAKGAFRHDGEKPIAGDIVAVRIGSSDEAMGREAAEDETGISGADKASDKKAAKSPAAGADMASDEPSREAVRISEREGALIESIKPRKNELVRPPLANLDIIFVVMAAAKPAPILTTFDKLICLAEYLNIEPVVIITKADVDPERASELMEIYKKSGFKVFKTDMGSEAEKERLRDFILNEAGDKLSCFAGASGVGKSTLMTTLFPNLNLKTGEISRKISRGKQTTRHVELYPISSLIDAKPGGSTASAGMEKGHQGAADANPPAGFIADTPGFSLLDFVRLDFFTKEDLPYCFREFDRYIGKCRYTKCTHLKEEGCAIVESVKNGEIPKERHDSFVEIYAELKNKHEWDKKPR